MTRVEQCLNAYRNWCNELNISTVSDINRIISENKTAELVNLSEIWHEQNISEIAERIKNNPQKKLILISGPSGSGKTTFANRLRLHLRVLGIRAISISLDNYFIKIEDMPKNDEGKADFEAFESIDYRLFNRHIQKLINGEKITVPYFDFSKAETSESAAEMQLSDNEIIIVEGIHALNEKLGMSVDDKNKYRIYCTALTCLKKDDSTRISSEKTRLVRRTVRDFYFRGTSPNFTFELWRNVEKGAQKNIYPYTDSADIVFNSSLLYEFGAYKSHVNKIFADSEVKEEYRHFKESILSLTDIFKSVDENYIGTMSIIREYIGGSSLT